MKGLAMGRCWGGGSPSPAWGGLASQAKCLKLMSIFYFLLRCADSIQAAVGWGRGKELSDVDYSVKSGCFNFLQPDFGLWAKGGLDCYLVLLG